MVEKIDAETLEEILENFVHAVHVRLALMQDEFQFCKYKIADTHQKLLLQSAILYKIAMHVSSDQMMLLFDSAVASFQANTYQIICWRRLVQVLLDKRFCAILCNNFCGITLVHFDCDPVFSIETSAYEKPRLMIYFQKSARACDKMAESTQTLPPLLENVTSTTQTRTETKTSRLKSAVKRFFLN